jgi:type II secretory pathway component GspD/PulD (secretin)
MKIRLVIVMLCLLASPAWARPQFKILSLQHRFAEELLPGLQPLVGANGSINAYGNQLIINAEPEELANIEQAVRSLDIVKRNWRINIQQGMQGSYQGRQVEIAGRASPGVTVIANDRSHLFSRSGDMTLNVLDGSQAYISVGQEIPYTSYWVNLTQRYASIAQNTEWHEVGTGFVVSPRQIGEMVDIEVTPRLSHPGGNGVIDFTELSTHVRAQPGEWVDLGGMLGRRDEVSRAILSGCTATGLRIKVE